MAGGCRGHPAGDLGRRSGPLPHLRPSGVVVARQREPRDLPGPLQHFVPRQSCASGVFDFKDSSVESAGIEGYMEVTLACFTLLTDSGTERKDGLLSISWAIKPPKSLSGPVELRVRVLPKRSDSGEWVPLGRLELVGRAWRVVDVFE